MLGHELIGGELSIPPDEGETDEPRRATFSIPGGGDDGGGGAVDDAAAICPSLNGKASMYPLPASMGHRGRAPPRGRLPRLGSATRAPRPPPSDQTARRALHPHDVLRMGLWCDLAQQRRAHRRP